MTLSAAEQSFFGIAKEATVGTAVAPTNFLRATAFNPVSNPNPLTDDSMQGSMVKVYDTIPGVIQTSVAIDGYVYADEINWYLASILGDFAVTGAGDPYTTAWSIKNNGQPKTYTLTDYDGNAATAYAGMVCSDLTINVTKDGLASFTSTWVGLSQASASTPTEVPGTTRALPTWAAAVTLNSLTTFKFIDYSVSIKRTVTADATLANSQSPSIIFAGGDLDVTGTATIAYDSSTGPTALGYSRTQGQIPLLIDIVSPASANRELKIQTSDVTFTTAPIGRTLGTYSTLAATWQANANATDAGVSAGKSPILVTTKAANPTGTYA
jgi:hypothetical protein